MCWNLPEDDMVSATELINVVIMPLVPNPRTRRVNMSIDIIRRTKGPFNAAIEEYDTIRGFAAMSRKRVPPFLRGIAFGFEAFVVRTRR